MVLISLFFVLFFLNCNASASASPIKKLDQYQEEFIFFAKNFPKGYKKIKARANASSFNKNIPIRNFALGYFAFKNKDYKNAIYYLTKSISINGNLNAKSLPHARKALKKNKNLSYSIVAPEAFYYLSHLALARRDIASANFFYAKAALFQNKNTPGLDKLLKSLRIEIDFRSHNTDIKSLLLTASETQNPEYFLRAAIASERKYKRSKAIDLFTQTLEYPKNDSTYLQAANAIERLLRKKNISLALKVRLAEAKRIKNKFAQAWNLLKNIEPKNLSNNHRFYFFRTKLRLAIDQKKYSKLMAFMKAAKHFLSQSQITKLEDDLGLRLRKKDRYKEILKLLSIDSKSKNARYARVMAAYKEKTKERPIEAQRYFREFDPRSYYAEKTWMSSCIDFYFSAKEKEYINCLKELANFTKGVSVGAGARFHLARYYEKKSEIDSAKRWYQSVYSNSPDSSYALLALEKLKNLTKNNNIENVSDNRLLNTIAKQGLHPNLMNRFWKLKSTTNIDSDYFWRKWNESIEKCLPSISNEQKKGLLFFGIYARGLSTVYLSKLDRGEKLIGYSCIARLGKNLSASHYYTRLYVREKKYSVDIFTLSREALSVLYPVPFREFVTQASKKYNVEVPRIYGIMRQESGFNKNAKSYAGALGLMQVMPRTGKMLNKRLKIYPFDLTDPKTSIRAGTKFYSDLQKQWNSNFEKIAVAYNAGPTRMKKWTELYEKDPWLFIEQIPIHQTHHYLKTTRENYDRYRILWEYYYD